MNSIIDNVNLNRYLSWLKKCRYCNPDNRQYICYPSDISNVIYKVLEYHKVSFEVNSYTLYETMYFLRILYRSIYLNEVSRNKFVFKEEIHSIGYKALIFMKENDWDNITNSISCYELFKRCISHDFSNLSLVKDTVVRLSKYMSVMY